MIILTGGDPLMRSDIFALARHGTNLGLRVVMATCGHLITDDVAADMASSGIKGVSISLDGPNRGEHDSFRGVEGAFDRTIEGINHIRSEGIPFQINTTVTTLNVKNLPAIHDLCVSLGADTFDLFFLVPTGRGSGISHLEISPGQYEETLKWAYALSKSSPIRIRTTCAPHHRRIEHQLDIENDVPVKRDINGRMPGCMAGSGFVFISHLGILQPCGFLDIPCGKLRDEELDFQKLYESSPVFQDLRNHNAYKGKCGGCEYIRVCGGCRARAFASTGDYLNEEPGCAYKPGQDKTGND
jgi:radical SAM protein with 4Fe4S-binding SPASM domain